MNLFIMLFLLLFKGSLRIACRNCSHIRNDFIHEPAVCLLIKHSGKHIAPKSCRLPLITIKLCRHFVIAHTLCRFNQIPDSLRINRIRIRHIILLRHGPEFLNRREVRKLHKNQFLLCAKIFSQITILIPDIRELIFQLAQILISFHPEMSHAAVIKTGCLHMQIGKTDCKPVFSALIDYQHISVIIMDNTCRLFTFKLFV